MLASGMALTGVAIFLLAHLSADTTWQSLVFPLILAGVGMGLIMAPANTVVMASAPVEKSGAASGIMTTTRQIGALLGVAILGAVLQSRLVTNITAALNNIPGMSEGVKAAIIAGLSKGGATSGMNTAGMPPATQEAMSQMFKSQFAASLNSAMMVAVVFCAVGVFVALLIKNKKTA